MITVAVAGSPAAATADFVCDGSDDQIEINAAIAQAAAEGGGDVVLAAGTYSTSSNIAVFGDGVHLQGAGIGDTIIQAAADWHASRAPSGAALNGAVVFCGVDGFSCSGITVDAQTNNVNCNGIVNVPAGTGSDTIAATQGTVCTNGVISDNEVLLPQGHNYSIWNLRGENVQILNNVIDGGATLADRDQSQEGIEIFGGHHVTVSDNVVKNIGNNAIFVQSIASQVPNSDYSDITITGNTIDFATNGILVTSSSDAVNGSMDATDVTISDNSISNATDIGIGLRNDSGSTVDPVIFARISVTGNTIHDEGAAANAVGIMLQNNTADGETLFSDIHVDGNHIFGAPTTDSAGQVTVVHYGNFTFSDNDLTITDAETASYLATFLYASGFTAEGNTFTGAGAAGVKISGSDQFDWRDNTINDWNSSPGAASPALIVDASSAFSLEDNSFSAANVSSLVIALGQNIAQSLTGNTFIADHDYTLAPYLSNLVLIGAAVHGIGNDLDNTIIGDARDNVLSGGLGNDTYYVDSAADTVTEALRQGYDILYTAASYALAPGSEIEQLTTTNNLATIPINLTGNEFGQLVRGNAGDNVIDGGGGADTMIGLGGNDNYYVDNPGDVIVEAVGGGYDIVRTSVSYSLTSGAEVEQLGTTYNLGTDPINLTGNEFGQLLRGNAGDNVLDGRGGADTMIGLGGNDNYYVDNAGDVITEAVGGGYDIVRTSVNYVLTPGAEVEQLGTTNTAGLDAISLTGNEFAQLLRGNAGDNVLDGRGGADTMTGFGGNDNYYVDNPGDTIVEAVGGGYDIVRSSVSYVLTSGAEVEQLGTTNTAGTGAVNLTGNEFGQMVRGNAGDNVLNGGGGRDTIVTNGGHDTIVISSPLGPGNVTAISDFDVTLDRIALNHAIFTSLSVSSELDASTFTYASNVTNGDQHVIYDPTAGAIFYDADGSGSSAAVLFAEVTPGSVLDNHDFFVV